MNIIKRNSIDGNSPTNSQNGKDKDKDKDKDSNSTESTTPTKKGTTLTQTLQSIRRSTKGSSSSKVNSLKKSDKAAIQDELAAEFSPPRHNKYQTIQSFRPEEVKELLSQHFKNISAESQQPPRSAFGGSDDGRRKFFHLRPGRRSGPPNGVVSLEVFKRDSGEISDSDIFTEDSPSPSPNVGIRAFVVHKQETASARSSMKAEEDLTAASSSKDSTKRLSRKETYYLNGSANTSSNALPTEKDKTIAELKDQLARERRLHSEQLNKMRAKQKKLKLKMNSQQEKLDSLLLLIEAREHNVQSKLASALGDHTTLEHM